MKRNFARHTLAVVLTALPVFAAATAQSQEATYNPANISHWRAQRYITVVVNHESFYLAYSAMVAGALIQPASLTFTPETVEMDADVKGFWNPKSHSGRHVVIELKTLEAVSASCTRNWCAFKSESGRALAPPLGQIHILPGPKDAPGDRDHGAKLFAAALNRLRVFVADTNSPLRDFSQRAAAWRAQNPRPPLPDDIRALRLLAEDAVKQKQPAEALNYYEMALEKYPTWPEAWFNAALIAGEMGYYGDAVEHMQSYLELVPDAPDAQAARDQIGMWQYKAGQQTQGK